MKTEITISQNKSGRLTVAFPYNPEFVAKVKTVPGYKWHPAEKHWSFPDTNGTLEKILKVFEGEEIHIAPALQAEVDSTVIARHAVPKQSQKDYNNLNAPTLANAISPISHLEIEKGARGDLRTSRESSFQGNTAIVGISALRLSLQFWGYIRNSSSMNELSAHCGQIECLNKKELLGGSFRFSSIYTSNGGYQSA
jgi:hypothetical protein